MSVITWIDKDGKKCKAFDLRTHIKDPKTGFVTKTQPYKLHINREKGTMYERAGIFYYPNGELVNPPKPAPAPVVAPSATNPNQIPAGSPQL